MLRKRSGLMLQLGLFAAVRAQPAPSAQCPLGIYMGKTTTCCSSGVSWKNDPSPCTNWDPRDSSGAKLPCNPLTGENCCCALEGFQPGIELWGCMNACSTGQGCVNRKPDAQGGFPGTGCTPGPPTPAPTPAPTPKWDYTCAAKGGSACNVCAGGTHGQCKDSSSAWPGDCSVIDDFSHHCDVGFTDCCGSTPTPPPTPYPTSPTPKPSPPTPPTPKPTPGPTQVRPPPRASPPRLAWLSATPTYPHTPRPCAF